MYAFIVCIHAHTFLKKIFLQVIKISATGCALENVATYIKWHQFYTVRAGLGLILRISFSTRSLRIAEAQ